MLNLSISVSGGKETKASGAATAQTCIVAPSDGGSEAGLGFPTRMMEYREVIKASRRVGVTGAMEQV